MNLAANSITSIIGASIAGIGSRATGRIAGTGMMTVAGGFGNGFGFPTGGKVSILTRNNVRHERDGKKEQYDPYQSSL